MLDAPFVLELATSLWYNPFNSPSEHLLFDLSRGMAFLIWWVDLLCTIQVAIGHVWCVTGVLCTHARRTTTSYIQLHACTTGAFLRESLCFQFSCCSRFFFSVIVRCDNAVTCVTVPYAARSLLRSRRIGVIGWHLGRALTGSPMS